MCRHDKIRTIKSGESGQAIVFGVILLLMFAAYGIVSVINIADESSTVEYGLRSREALYAAETGLEYALEELRSGVANAGNINNLVVGNAVVNVRNKSDTLLTSVAVTQNPQITRSIALKIEVTQNYDAFKYALYIDDTNTFAMNNATEIDGDMLFDGLDLTLGNRLTLENFTITVPQAATITNKTGDTITRIDYQTQNKPPYAFPSMETTYYDGYINNVHGYPSQSTQINNKTDLSDYPDNVYYCDGNLTIKKDVTGPGIICASGRITFDNNAQKVGPDVQLIAGSDIRLRNVTISSGDPVGTILFSHSNIQLQDGSEVDGAIVTMGSFMMLNSNTRLNGPCVAYGSSQISSNFDIEGCLYTADISRINEGKIIFSEDSITDIVIPGLKMPGGTEVKRLAWKEI